jgi:tetratricopeptide (TPR) repeat protein
VGLGLVEDDDNIIASGDNDGERISGQSSSTEAAALALALSAATYEKDVASRAAKFLEEQTKLVRLQAEDLREEDRLRRWSQRARYVNDLVKVAFGLGAAFVILTLAVGLGALVWNAYDATGLMIEPIKAPPDFAERGLDGTVLARRLLDKLNGYIGDAEKWTFRSPDSISGNWGDDSKVEIPETGISVFELSRFLRRSLGHETSMSGELYRTPSGIALTVRVGGGTGTTFEGREQDIDALLSRAAQSLLAQTQPYRYVWMLYADGRSAASVAPVARQLAEAASGPERAWLQSAWEEDLDFAGKYKEAAVVSADTIAIAPDNPFGYFDMSPTQWALGHLQQAYDDIRISNKLLGSGVAKDIEPEAVPFLRANADSFAADLTGAYGDAIAADIAESKTGLFDLNVSGPGALATDYAQNHDGATARAILAQHHLVSDDILIQPQYVVVTGPDLPNFYLLASEGNWAGARDALERTDQSTLGRNNINDVRHTLIWPWLAYAWTRTGQLRDAEALIAKTPLDCTLCLEMRGRIDEAKGDTARAVHWFDRAIRDAPAIPFSASDWGVMLLRANDFGGAISKFQQAHQKSPHYADALELWGEALVRDNHSDLAVAKFSEAAKYAPNWGRLHLKYGEALLWSGRTDEARKQFALAATLGLTPSEKVELTRMTPHV